MMGGLAAAEQHCTLWRPEASAPAPAGKLRSIRPGRLRLPACPTSSYVLDPRPTLRPRCAALRHTSHRLPHTRPPPPPRLRAQRAPQPPAAPGAPHHLAHALLDPRLWGGSNPAAAHQQGAARVEVRRRWSQGLRCCV